jgi:hypothetical protein
MSSNMSDRGAGQPEKSTAASSASLNIFTCCDRGYEDFAPIFAASCFWSNPGATVELGVENVERFMKTYGSAMEAIRPQVPENSLVIREGKFRTSAGKSILVNAVRFVTTPQIVSDYVYISDIDIITLDPDIVGVHVRRMAETGLPFCNLITKSTRLRLSGLHFTRYDAMYPLPELDDLIADVRGDEALLYAIVERKVGSIPPQEGKGFRPVHGIHVSPNRSAYVFKTPDGRIRPGWLHYFPGRHQENWQIFRHSPLFKSIEPLLSSRMAGVVWEIDNFDPRKLMGGPDTPKAKNPKTPPPPKPTDSGLAGL